MVQIAWFLVGAFIVASLFAITHRLYPRLGLAPVFTMIGGFQHMQANLVSSVYVETLPGIFLSPGSVVLFMGTVSVVLAVYILEGAEEGRRLIYGVIITNIAVSILSAFIALQTHDVALGSPGTEYVSLLVSSLRVFIGGTIALTIDVIAVIVIYEYISDKISKPILRLSLTLALIAAIDSVLFGILAFAGTELWTMNLVYAAIAKMIAGIWYSILFLLYVSLRRLVTDTPQSAQDVFGILTYRQKYKLVKAKTERDAMTGLYNRAFFDQSIHKKIDEQTPFTLMLIDIDDFKNVNDTYGHLGGDRALMQLKDSLLSTFRDNDIVCRFGGDEFAVIVPNIEPETVVAISERLRDHLDTEYDKEDPIYEFSSLKISIGIASFPNDGEMYEDVIQAADRRLYNSKRSGKNMTSSFSDDRENYL